MKGDESRKARGEGGGQGDVKDRGDRGGGCTFLLWMGVCVDGLRKGGRAE